MKAVELKRIGAAPSKVVFNDVARCLVLGVGNWRNIAGRQLSFLIRQECVD